MGIRNFIHGFLIAISYYSLKKVIDEYPEPYRSFVVFGLRLTLFFILFLILFSFFSNQIYSIGRNIDSPVILVNIFIGVFFILCIFVSYILTAVMIEIYRKISELKKETGKKIDGMKEKVQAPSKVLRNSLKTISRTAGKTGHWIGKSSRSIYDSSRNITSASFDFGRSKLTGLLPKKNKKNVGTDRGER